MKSSAKCPLQFWIYEGDAELAVVSLRDYSEEYGRVETNVSGYSEKFSSLGIPSRGKYATLDSSADQVIPVTLMMTVTKDPFTRIT